MTKLVFVLLLAVPLLAQQKQPVSSLQEDCGVTFSFTQASSGAQAAGTVTAGSTGTTAVIDNRQAGCIDWLVTYSPDSTAAAVSLLFQTADDVAGIPGTWSAYGGTLTTGINPNTATTTGGAVTEATGVKYPFLRMNLTTFAGGTISGKLYGWKRRPTYVTVTGGGGCPGTIGTPCVVVGTKSPNAVVPGATNLGVLPCVANAAAPTNTEGFQVPCSVDLSGALRIIGTVSGNKTNNNAAPGATNVGVLPCLANAAAPTWTEGFQVLCSVDLAGAMRVIMAATSTAFADGLSNTEPLPTAGGAAVNQRVFPTQYNGSTWDRMFVCSLQTRVTLSDGTRTQLIALSGSTVIRVCHIHMTTTAAEDFTISYGTGSACGTGTTTIDKYLSVQALAIDFQPTAALRGLAANAICVTQSATQAAEVTVVYAQF